MLMKGKIASGAEQDEPSTDSVYDFLYHDARRIGSFLAQFDDFGHLQQITANETVSKGGKRGFSLRLAGNVPLLPGAADSAEGSITLNRDPSHAGAESQARVYDPLWSNARALLDYLDERQLIERNLTAGRLGQFVMASGELSILNAGLLEKMWEASGIRDNAIRQSGETARMQWNANPQNATLRGGQRDKAEKAATKMAESNATSAMDILPLFPHSAQCTIKGKDFSVWSSLSEKGMVSAVADLSLKHGTEIPGEWHLLGVLDALPSPVPAQIPIVGTGVPSHMGDLIKNLSNLGRTLLGRAPSAYGVTALLIFRDVSLRST